MPDIIDAFLSIGIKSVLTDKSIIVMSRGFVNRNARICVNTVDIKEGKWYN